MEWTAKYYDNVYLLTDDDFNMREDKVVYVSPEDNTIVVDHRSINNPVDGKPYKIVWCYEPGEKMAGRGPLKIKVHNRVLQTMEELIPVQPMEPPQLGNWFYETMGYQ